MTESSNFVPRDAIHIARSLVPSGVRLSVTLVYRVETAKLTIKLFNRQVGPSF